MNRHLKRSGIAILCCLLITAMLIPALAIADVYAPEPNKATGSSATSSTASSASSTSTPGTPAGTTSTAPSSNTTATETQTTSIDTPAIAGKDEVVYAKLDTLGTTKGIYVVNIFTNTEAKQVTDKGRYTKITNLTTSAKITEDYGTITFDAPAGRFYYQGDLDASTPLPWNVILSYKLDGRAIEPADLAGKSGNLVIGIDITPNTAVDSTFADNYLLQVSGTFPGDVVGDITAENASIADSGSDKVVSFMMLPGKEGHYVISTPVVDFEFDGFRIAAVPVSFAIEFEDEDTANLTSGIVELQDAIATLDTGASSLQEGAAQIGAGLATLTAQNSTLTNGSALIASGITDAASGAGALNASTLSDLVPGAAQIASGSTSYLGGLEQGITDAQAQATLYGGQVFMAQEAYATALQNAYAKILGGGAVTADDLTAIDAAARTLVQVQSAAAAYNATATALTGTKNGYIPLDAGIQNLNDGIQQQSVGITDLADGLGTLSSRFSQFNAGIRAYTSGVSTLSSGFGSFSEGLSEFASGTTQLHESTATLDQDLIDGIKEELENYLGGDFTPRSFVDSHNTAVNQVQFIIMTDPIEIPEEVKVTASVEEDKTIWERFLDLFN